MFALNYFTIFVFSVLIVSAHPVAIDVSPRSPSPVTGAPLQVSGSQEPFTGNFTTKKGSHTLQDLFIGNQKFRQAARLQADKLENEGVCSCRISLTWDTSDCQINLTQILPLCSLDV